MCVIFNPKTVTIGSGVDPNKKIFLPIRQKLHLFNGRFSLAIKNSKLSCKKSIFWPMGQKIAIFCFDQRQNQW